MRYELILKRSKFSRKSA